MANRTRSGRRKKQQEDKKNSIVNILRGLASLVVIAKNVIEFIMKM